MTFIFSETTDAATRQRQAEKESAAITGFRLRKMRSTTRPPPSRRIPFAMISSPDAARQAVSGSSARGPSSGALRVAMEIDGRKADAIPSTKGRL